MATYWEMLRNDLMGRHPDDMQKCRIIEVSLHEAEEALTKLGSIGHQFHLEPGPPLQRSGWPKTVWHADGRSHIVYHPLDVNALGEGPWCDTLEEAKRLAGVRTQFAGRAGVRTANLPMKTENGNGS